MVLMFITLFQNLSPKNMAHKTTLHVLYGDSNKVPVDVVAPCSVTNPTFRLGSANFDFSKTNYLYCDAFARYYFIDDTVIQNNGIVEIHCSVDALSSFLGQILELSTMIERQENKAICNPFIPDNLIVGRVDREIVKKNIGPVGGQASGTHIVLTTTGGE